MKKPKIDYTPSGKTWEEIKQLPIECKWSPVAIESEYRLDKVGMEIAIMSMDETLSGYRHGGNDRDFNERIWRWTRIPEDFNFMTIKNGKIYNSYSDELKDDWNLAYSNYTDKVKKWQKDFHRSELDNNSDCNLFLVDLISSCYARGPRAFFEPKTGDIGLLHRIGKWPKSIGYVADQVETFARENKHLDIIVTFFDERYDKNGVCTNIPLATIRINNGEIIPIKTRTWNEVKYLEKVNYFKGSKNYHTKLYYKFRNIIFNNWKKLGEFMEKYFHNSTIYNAWVDEHNYNITRYEYEQYFTEKELYKMIDRWHNWCKEKHVALFV